MFHVKHLFAKGYRLVACYIRIVDSAAGFALASGGLCVVGGRGVVVFNAASELFDGAA